MMNPPTRDGSKDGSASAHRAATHRAHRRLLKRLPMPHGFRTETAPVLVVLAVGALLAVCILYFTYRTVRLSNQMLDATQKGQVTERFTRAIDQLGATEDKSPVREIRIGGIYALERIARDSEEYRLSVVDVVSACFRENIKDHEDGARRPPPADILAILKVFDNMSPLFDGRARPYLAGIVARRYELVFAKLPHADLAWANLSGSNLEHADLSGANLWGADLSNTILSAAKLDGVRTGPETKWDGAKLPLGFDPPLPEHG
jgi:hypothetical protein